MNLTFIVNEKFRFKNMKYLVPTNFYCSKYSLTSCRRLWDLSAEHVQSSDNFGHVCIFIELKQNFIGLVVLTEVAL